MLQAEASMTGTVLEMLGMHDRLDVQPGVQEKGLIKRGIMPGMGIQHGQLDTCSVYKHPTVAQAQHWHRFKSLERVGIGIWEQNFWIAAAPSLSVDFVDSGMVRRLYKQPQLPDAYGQGRAV